ncbi:MAG: class I SAM-dependent DNA methyltransferase [Thermoplasmatota archaeon]
MPDEIFQGSYAENYDSMVEEFNSRGDLVVFGLMYDHISPGERVLDIGIGTGLGSARLYRYGLDVYGIDASADMLAQCWKKNMARELKLVDITADPIPYGDGFFDHVTALGVFHLFRDLSGIFREAGRVLKPGGTFTFTIMSDERGEPSGRGIDPMMTHWGKEVFKHGREYISDLSAGSGFSMLSRLLFADMFDPEDGSIMYFWVYVFGKIGD